MNTDLKIVFAGPPQSGKTVLADLVAAISPDFQENTKPTFCVRILEFSATINVLELQRTISAQIWDTSGDERYRAAWPAIAHNADGVVIIYDGTDPSQASQVDMYAKAFAKSVGDLQVMFVANKKGECEKLQKPRLQKPRKVQLVSADPKVSADEFLDKFNHFLSRVQQEKVKRIENREKEMVGEKVEPEETGNGEEEG